MRGDQMIQHAPNASKRRIAKCVMVEEVKTILNQFTTTKRLCLSKLQQRIPKELRIEASPRR